MEERESNIVFVHGSVGAHFEGIAPFHRPAFDLLDLPTIEEQAARPRHSTGTWVQFAAERYVPLQESELPRLLEARFADLVERMESVSKEMAKLQHRLAEVEAAFASQPRCRQAVLYDLGGDKYQLKQPLAVQLEEYDDEAVARVPELDVFASATTDSEALALLKGEVVSLYDELVSCAAEELGERPTAWLRLLKRLVNVAEAP